MKEIIKETIRRIVYFFSAGAIKKKIRHLPKIDLAAEVPKNTILVMERYQKHDECLPGCVKYFQDLGYNVEVVSRYQKCAEMPFSNYPNLPRFLFLKSKRAVKKMLGSKRTAGYEYIFFNSSLGRGGVFCLDDLKVQPNAKNGCLFMFHNGYHVVPDKYKNRIFCIVNGIGQPQLNPHYFGEFPKTEKNQKTVFLTIGRQNARNYDSLIDATKRLASQNKEFEIRNIGWAGKINIPDGLEDYFINLGRLDFPNMYSQIQQADFIIAGLDPELHQTYKEGQATGNLQLSFGFKKPMLIEKSFGPGYELTMKNAILYRGDGFYKAMLGAVEMTGAEYAKMQTALGSTAKKVWSRSLKNLETLLKVCKK